MCKEDTRSHKHHPSSPDYDEPECQGCGIIMDKNTGAYCALCQPLVEKLLCSQSKTRTAADQK